MLRIFLFLSLFVSLPSWAQSGIAVVDFQKASQTVKEGKNIQAELMRIKDASQAKIKDLEAQILGMRTEFEKQEMILSEDAKREKYKQIQAATQNYQQAVMQAQQQFQEAYEKKAGTLFQKLKKVCETIGAEKGYTLILEVSSGAVVYQGTAVDITPELIRRYDAGG
jgi:outer membrane protein